MNITDNEFKNYKPINEVNICSNFLMGGGFLVGYGEFAPLRIGSGEIPIVWLSTQIAPNKWMPIVKENEALISNLNIYKEYEKRKITISFGSKVLLVAQMMNDNYCRVPNLDLRLTGVNIFGDELTGLTANNTISKNNRFVGVKFLFGMDVK